MSDSLPRVFEKDSLFASGVLVQLAYLGGVDIKTAEIARRMPGYWRGQHTPYVSKTRRCLFGLYVAGLVEAPNSRPHRWTLTAGGSRLFEERYR